MLTEIISATIAGLVVWVATRYLKSFQMAGLRKVRVFEPDEDGNLNRKFYDYFREQIDKATEEIWITGEGFEFKGPKSEDNARDYNERMRRALKRGVHITRIQTANPLHSKWAKMLKELFDKETEGRFHLYIINNQEFQDVASVCVIDPARRRKNVVEFMLSAEKDIEDSQVRIASTAVFLHGRRELAKAMKENISAMKRYSITTQCVSQEDLNRFI